MSLHDPILITATTTRLAPLSARQAVWAALKAAHGHPLSPEAEARICTETAAPILRFDAPLCEIVALNQGRARRIAEAKGLPLSPTPITHEANRSAIFALLASALAGKAADGGAL